MQKLGNFSELIERLHKSLIGLAKNFAQSFRKHPDRLLRPASFETWVAFEIVRIDFLETDVKIK